MNLSELSPFTPAVVDTVTGLDSSDPIAKRLRELGFVEGEPVRIVARGPLGADPLPDSVASHDVDALAQAIAAEDQNRSVKALLPAGETTQK